MSISKSEGVCIAQVSSAVEMDVLPQGCAEFVAEIAADGVLSRDEQRKLQQVSWTKSKDFQMVQQALSRAVGAVLIGVWGSENLNRFSLISLKSLQKALEDGNVIEAAKLLQTYHNPSSKIYFMASGGELLAFNLNESGVPVNATQVPLLSFAAYLENQLGSNL